jgi:hypothetical protein
MTSLFSDRRTYEVLTSTAEQNQPRTWVRGNLVPRACDPWGYEVVTGCNRTRQNSRWRLSRSEKMIFSVLVLCTQVNMMFVMLL